MINWPSACCYCFIQLCPSLCLCIWSAEPGPRTSSTGMPAIELLGSSSAAEFTVSAEHGALSQ